MRALAGRLEGQAGQLRAIGDIFAAGHAGDMAILLRGVADALADLAALAADLAAQQPGRAGGDGLKLEQALHEGGFARAVGTEQPDGAAPTLTDTPSNARCRPKTLERPSVSMTVSADISFRKGGFKPPRE